MFAESQQRLPPVLTLIQSNLTKNHHQWKKSVGILPEALSKSIKKNKNITRGPPEPVSLTCLFIPSLCLINSRFYEKLSNSFSHRSLLKSNPLQ